jgi:hypothetical protein
MCGDDLKFIKQCVNYGRIFWSYHSNMRLQSRFIGRDEVLDSMKRCEIIESYPNDFPLPSCLCLSYDRKGDSIHYVIAMDKAAQNIRFITIYRPDPNKWKTGFRERK